MSALFSAMFVVSPACAMAWSFRKEKNGTMHNNTVQAFPRAFKFGGRNAHPHH
jgi:hypothetical protein